MSTTFDSPRRTGLPRDGPAMLAIWAYCVHHNFCQNRGAGCGVLVWYIPKREGRGGRTRERTTSDGSCFSNWPVEDIWDSGWALRGNYDVTYGSALLILQNCILTKEDTPSGSRRTLPMAPLSKGMVGELFVLINRYLLVISSKDDIQNIFGHVRGRRKFLGKAREKERSGRGAIDASTVWPAQVPVTICGIMMSEEDITENIQEVMEIMDSVHQTDEDVDGRRQADMDNDKLIVHRSRTPEETSSASTSMREVREAFCDEPEKKISHLSVKTLTNYLCGVRGEQGLKKD
ncbi:hypothetical protein B0H17DRAFT_1150830 [Mycena rosella]|uniref:Uncharacterized protein n=1 Tax=Mycena rosella TaxID=1033263 RepID=A0AAD7BRH7_MYCRO|nr:hypothetical protein B0H17DRAFT_1150830 [Mycena rosella]